VIPLSGRRPDFGNLVKVLQRKRPDRPTLFELFLNNRLYNELSEGAFEPKNDGFDGNRQVIAAFHRAGYDYVSMRASAFNAHVSDGREKERARKNTISLNDGPLITDWQSFEQIKWREPEHFREEIFEKCALPEGMKFLTIGPGGVLESAIFLWGMTICVCFFMTSRSLYGQFSKQSARAFTDTIKWRSSTTRLGE